LDIRTALKQGTELLSSRLTAEVLLGYATGVERAYFYAHPEQELRDVEWLHYGRYLHERLKGKPTQYITHRQEFYSRDFRVTPDVLIPRPETELLVDAVLKLPARTVIDVGTGSGAIAVTLSLESGAAVIATDISRAALQVAKDNARRLGASVRFVAADLLAPFADSSVDAVISNPPYVPETDRALLQREVRDWEPAVALFAGPLGMDVYEQLIPEAFRVLRSRGSLALEFGFGQAELLSALIEGWQNPRIRSDLAGIPRVLVCEKP
jgi:release factor glutamine methyltransferase